jgi:hypothetical protein
VDEKQPAMSLRLSACGLTLADDYKDEKRLLTAAMLRRLEVEEWDKERMKHFYLGECRDCCT